MTRPPSTATAPASPESNLSSADRIRRLNIISRRLVTSIFAGSYKSVFRGRGIEFEELREYQPGDDIRSIDWNVAARTGKTYVKRFIEEREMNVLLAVDRSASMQCPSPRGSKSSIVSDVCALLIGSATRSNDRIGLLTFGNRVEQYIPPGKGFRHAQRLLAAIENDSAAQGTTDLAGALDYLQRVTRRPVILFIISDFVCSGFSSQLSAASRRHDVVAVAISDPTDRELPDAGLLQMKDAENGKTILIDSSSPEVRKAYSLQSAKRQTALRQTIAATGSELLTISTASSPLQSLHRFFMTRQRRMRMA